jgi:AmmeMemoRadiSam system protein B
VIVATSHYSLSRFTLTRKSFQTPLGLVETAEDVVDALADGFGPDLFEDECAHQPEHSIELQTVLMAHALTRRPFRIVPLLVGSFSDAVDAGDDPSTLGDVARMVRTLTEVEQGSDLRFCYVVSGDLAHMGPKFGDRWRIDSARSRHCRTRDEALLARMADGDPRSLFAAISEEGDERRVCGFPPLYVALSAARPTGGRLLCYDQFVDPSGSEIVSFASMVFDGPSPKKQPGP